MKLTLVFVSKSISNNDRSSFHHFQNQLLVVNLSVNKNQHNLKEMKWKELKE